jgi:hypothetical protein
MASLLQSQARCNATFVCAEVLITHDGWRVTTGREEKKKETMKATTDGS